MKIIPTLIFFLSVFLLVGCGDSSIQGNAFVVKGDGDIKPAAGRTVYLIPEKSVNALLTRAVHEVSPAIMDSYESTIKSLCAPSKEAVVVLDKAIKTELQGVKDRGTIPSSGCSSLQNEMLQLDSALKSVKTKHSEKVNSIESELKELKSKRATKINSAASALREKALANISIRLTGGGSWKYGVILTNNTDYYLKCSTYEDITVKALSKGVEIGHSVCSSYLDGDKDQYGFDMGYSVAPHTTVPELMGRLDVSMTSTPEFKLLIDQQNLPVNGEGYIVPDKAIISNVKFWNKSIRNKVGDRYEYRSKEVSFYEIASGVKYPEDPRIKELEQNLANENKAYKSNMALKSYSRTKTKSDSCNTDKLALEKAIEKQVELDQIAVEIDSCLKGTIDTQPLSHALTSLGRIADTPKLPDVVALINDSAVKHVVNIILGEEIRKSDTTINGFFKFNKVAKGNYLLYSEYKDSFVDGFWLTQITVKEDAQFDLNNNTFIDESVTDYLVRTIANVR